MRLPRSSFLVLFAALSPLAFAQDAVQPELEAKKETIYVPDPTPPAPPIVGSTDELWEPGRWSLQIEPTVWFAAMGGDVQAGDGPEMEFKDYGDDADSAHAALSLRGMYRKDRWTVMADGFWLNFDESDQPSGSAIDFTLWSADVNLGWELWEWKRERIVNGKSTDTGVVARLIPYAGLRMIAPDVDTTTGGGDFSGSDEFLFPLVGLRIELEILEWLSLDTGADFGGLDLLGDDAYSFDWTVNIRVMLTDNIGAQIGFRQMYMNLESDDVLLDGSIGGLMAGLTIRF
jgi:hypothetical protein